MPEQVPLIPFVLLAGVALGGAVAAMLTPNVVHAAIWVLGVMVAVAGVFFLLSAEFLALVQLLVYAGAVAVLLLFVIMLTLRRREDAVRSRDLSWLAFAIAAGFLASAWMALTAFRPVAVKMPEVTPNAARFGELLFTRWALPFEIASVVLLIALVGAVLWAGGDDAS